MNKDTTMSANELHATARAQQDYVDGLGWDENPFPVGTLEHAQWADEMDKLMIAESIRELSAA